MSNKTSQMIVIGLIIVVIATLIYLIYSRERRKASTGTSTISTTPTIASNVTGLGGSTITGASNLGGGTTNYTGAGGSY